MHMPDPYDHATQMAVLLTAIVPAPAAGEFLEGRYLLPGTGAERRFYHCGVDLVADVLRSWRGVRHCYTGVALRRGKSGTAADVSRAGACWADIDSKLWGDDEAAARVAVLDFEPAASMIVHSGGGFQPYWLLASPYDVRAHGRTRLEALNAALARAVAGQGRTPDHVQDVARILRLPGTLNFKYTPPRSVTVVRSEPTRRYTLEELETVVGVRYPWAARDTAQREAPAAQWRRSEAAPQDLRERAAQGRIRRATLDLLDLPGPADYKSASEADSALAAGLISAGLTAWDAYALIVSSARGVDALARKGQKHGEYYWRRTVARAAGFVGPVVQTSGGLRAKSGSAQQALRFLRGEGAAWVH